MCGYVWKKLVKHLFDKLKQPLNYFKGSNQRLKQKYLEFAKYFLSQMPRKFH